MKLVVSVLFVLLGAPAAWAARPLAVEDLHKLSRVGDVRLSPDGKWVAFSVAKSDVAKNKTVRNLWLVPAAGGPAQALTFADKGSNGDPRFSPDSRALYFVSNRTDGKPQVFRLPLGGGEARPITSVGIGVDSYALSPDGKTLAFVASVFPDCTDLPCSEKKAKEMDEAPVKARIITDVPFRRWDSWVDGRRNHIFVMPAEGGEAKDLTPGDVDSPIWSQGGEEMAFSPDGQEICFSRYVGNEALVGNSDLFTIPVAGGTPRAITTNPAGDTGPLYSPDGRFIAYGAALRPGLESDLTRLFVYDRKTGETRNVFEAVDRAVGSYVWSPDSQGLLVTFEDAGQLTLARLDLAGLELTRLFASGTTDGVQVAKDGSFVVFSNTDFAHPAEIFRLGLGPKDRGKPTPLTSLNAEAMREVELGAFSSFTFPGWQGEAVQSWLVKPPAFDPGKKYPLLLLMHGGPENAWDNQFHYRWNAQVFAAAGYVVLLPNFHGSSGFGLKFMDAIKGQWGGAPYEDQMGAVDAALQWPYVDQTRLAAAGASYGGYMANWVAGQTDRFRALVSHDGLYDLTAALYTSDFVGGLESEFKGVPWRNPQALIAQAPATYAKNFKTPMLIVHGEKDYRVDPSQGLAMFQVLQAMGVPSKLLYFQEENHWVLKPANSVLWYHTVLDWLAEWVKPDKAEYEKRLKR